MPVFGSLTQLAAALRQQAQDTGRIELTQATMWGTDTRVPQLLQAELGRPGLTLVVSAAAIPTDPVTSLRFTVATPSAPADGILGLIGVGGVIVTFDLVGPDLEVDFTLEIPLPTGWRLATSWPELASDPVANTLAFTAATLTVDTHPDVEPVTFTGTLGLGGSDVGLDLVGQLLPGTAPSITLAGAIRPGPDFDLRAPLLSSAPPPLGGLISIGPPYFGLRSLQVSYGGDDDDEDGDGTTYPVSQWLVGADVSIGTTPLTLAAVPAPYLSGFALALVPDRPEAATLQALLDALLGDRFTSTSFTALFGTVPFVRDVYDALMEAFAFQGFYADIAVGAGAGVGYLALHLGSTVGGDGQPTYQLPIVPGLPKTERFDVEWAIFDPLGLHHPATMTLTIAARLNFADGYPFELEVALPSFMVTGRYAGPPIVLSLAQLEEQLFGGHLPIPLGFDVTFTGLDFEANPPAGSYALTVEAGGAIELFGTRLLSLTDGSLRINRSYPNRSSTAIDALRFSGTIGLGPLDFTVTAQVGDDLDTIFSIHTVGLTLGGLLTQLVRLVDPYLDLRLEPPWDVLDTIDLDKLLLTVNVTKGEITLSYPIGLDLGFVTIDAVGLRYQRAAVDGSAPADLRIEITGTFLGLHYGGGEHEPPALGWNPVTDRAPAVPGAGDSLFDLQYVLLGQHVTVDGDLSTIANVFKALRGTAVPLTPGTADPSKLPGVRFDAASQWLIAAQFSVMGAITISGVFNDPSLAGIRIALGGESVGTFAGLELEILYTRVTPTIGLYHTELKLPDAMRHLELGEVSVTLPIVVVDIYTNGNFRIDFGFPKGLDFSRSFNIQVFPFVGYGGFYLALLDGQTSARVPQVTNGRFSPVIEAGLGLSLGVGKTIDEGPFTAGATLTVVGILEGVVGWFTPSGTDAATDRYHWVQGTVALTGKVFGRVDFAVISVDVRVTAQVIVTLTIEAYEPIHVALVADVSVQASIDVFFVRVHFSFAMTLDLDFTIGAAGTPPWQLADGNRRTRPGVPVLAAQDASRRRSRPWPLALAAASQAPLDFTPRSVAHLLGAPPVLQTIDATLVPGFTRGDEGAPVQGVLLLFLQNSIPAAAHAVTEVATVGAVGADAAFNQLAARLFAWVVGALGDHIDGPTSVVTATDLRRVAAALYDPAVEDGPLAYANLRTFLAANFAVRVLARTPGTTVATSGTVFPMLPDLKREVNGYTVDFATHTPIDTTYQQAIDAYLHELAVAYENDVEAVAGGGGAGARAAARAASAAANGSMAELVFGNWFALLARSVVSAAVAVTRAYPYEVPATGGASLADVCASFPAAEGHEPVTPAEIIAANRATPGLLSTSTALPLTGVQYQVRAGDSYDSIASAFAAIPQLRTTAATLRLQIAGANSSAAVLQSGVTIPLSDDLVYHCQAGDTMVLVAATYLVRSEGGALLSRLADLRTTVQGLVDANHPFTPDQPIPDGTAINVPIELAGTATRTARLGETLTRLAATLLAPTVGSAGISNIANAFFDANPDLPRAPRAPLAAGTVVKLPLIAVMVEPGDTIDGIAVAFGAPSLGLAAVNWPDLLAVGAVLELGPLQWHPAAADSFGTVMGELNLGVDDLAGSIAAVEGSLAPGSTLTVPQVPALTLAQLQRQLLVGGHLNTAAASISRFLLHGLRLPKPTHDGTTSGLYALTGQQFFAESGADVTVTLGVGARTGVELYMGAFTADGEDTIRTLAHRFAPNSPNFENFLGGVNLQGWFWKPPAGTTVYFPGATEYVTIEGDYGWTIAERFASDNGVAYIGELRHLNPTVDFDDGLPVGTHVRLPIATTTTTVLGDTPETVTGRFVAADDLDGVKQFLTQLVTLNPPIRVGVAIPPDTVLALPTTSRALPVEQIVLQWSSDELAVMTALDNTSFRATSTATRMPLYRDVPERWPLAQVLHWQAAVAPTGSRFAGGPTAGEPTIWPFPASLQRALTSSGPEPVLQLVTARSDSPADAGTTAPVASYAWATAVGFGVRQVEGVDGPLPNTYQVTGADQSGRDRLELLWRYLATPPSAGTVTATLLRPPSPTGGNPAGVTSDPLDGAATFVVQANLSTVSTSGAIDVHDDVAAPALAHSAALSDAPTLCKLLWECSVVHGGGYYLQYVTTTGAGLPEHLFRNGPDASLTLLVLVDEGVAPPAPPPVRPAHNCAVVTSNIPAGSTQVFVQPVAHTAGANQSADDVAAAIAEAHGVAVTGADLLAANPGNVVDTGGGHAFRPGTEILAAPAPTKRVADAPAGSTGFEVTRADPGPGVGTSHLLDSLFQLLSFAIAEGGGFRSSLHGLPAGPAGSDADGGVGNGTWDYRALVPVARYAADGLPTDAPPPSRWTLPSPWLDPYRGIAPDSAVTIDLGYRDLYGNTLGNSPGTVGPLTIPVGYFDDLIALSAWPSVAADFAFAPGSPPTLEVDIDFDPSRYVAGPGLSAEAAAHAAAVHRARFARIAYQLGQDGVTAVLRTSLDQTAAGQQPHPLVVGRLRAFALSVHAFLRAAEDLLPHRTAITEGETLAAVATRFTVSVADLARANADVDAWGLFDSGRLAIPHFDSFRHGGTLQGMGVDADQVRAGSLDLPLTPGVDLSLASQPWSYTLTGAPTPGPSLRQIGEATKADPGRIAAANATHPLTTGVPLVAAGVTLTAGSGDTLATMVERFAHLAPPVPTTAAELGSANQDVAGVFDAASAPTLRIIDRLVAATGGETLRSVSTGPGAPDVATLVTDNLATVDVFPPGTAIWASNTTEQLQPGDTLREVASRHGIDLATLAGLAANAQAALTARHGLALTIPGQVVIGPDGPLPAARVLVRPVVADDIGNNWFTGGLFRAGTLQLGTIELTVTRRDLAETLYSKAQGKGYTGTPVEFNGALASALAANPAVVDHEGVWQLPPVTVGTTRTLQATAHAASVPVGSVIRSNGSLRGLLRAGATVTVHAPHPTTITLGADDTLGTLAARFTAAGVPMTLADLASHPEIVVADLLVEGAPVLQPALALHDSIPFTTAPRNPEPIYAVTLALELARPTDRVDPDFAGVPSVVLASSPILPKATPGDDAARTLQAFAADFEAAFPGLKAAVSQRQQGVAGAAGGSSGAASNDAPDTGQLWVVDMRADGGLTYTVDAGATTASSYALPPLSTDLLSYDAVAVRPYVSGEPLGTATGRAFRSIDLDAWLGQFLTAVDAFLSASSAPAARFLDAALLDQVIADKQRIAASLASQVVPVFSGGPAGDLPAARGALEQALLVSLSTATSVSTIVQVPVTVRAPAGVDPTLAPRLAGALVAVGGSSSPSPYSLSTAKVPLAAGTRPLTFTVSVERPATDRVLDVDLRYAVTEIEHSISDVSGIADYQRSSWLTFLRPASLEPSGVVGPIRVPIPLRAAPAPPTMRSQTATPSVTPIGPPQLDELKRWDYSFSFDHPTAEQDTRYVRVAFNGSPATMAAPLRSEGLEAVFASLAEFVSVYPALQADLGMLTRRAAGSASSISANAVAVFAQLVHSVADALALAPVIPPIAADLPGIVLDYTVTVDGDVLALGLPSPPPAAVGWPDIAADGELLLAQPVTPTDAVRRYLFPSGPSSVASRHEWSFRHLDVTLLQRAVSAMWVVRNQDLGGPVAPEFVYRTAVAAFASPVVPLLVNQVVVPIGVASTGQTVAQALTAAFTGLFGTGEWSADVKLGARYGYGLGGGNGIVAMLPVFLISRSTIGAADVGTLAAEADRLVSKWSGIHDPSPENGHFMFDLTVYAAASSASTTTGLAVLDLENLEYSLG